MYADENSRFVVGNRTPNAPTENRDNYLEIALKEVVELEREIYRSKPGHTSEFLSEMANSRVDALERRGIYLERVTKKDIEDIIRNGPGGEVPNYDEQEINNAPEESYGEAIQTYRQTEPKKVTINGEHVLPSAFKEKPRPLRRRARDKLVNYSHESRKGFFKKAAAALAFFL